ncbi:hypothetical protein C0992_010520 [Termitomyces sp. T32_za158]|nr:hypothetical protein C0992_010520 [Termitomyces sp. T32_za158]
MAPISPNSRREGSSSDIDFSPSTRTSLLHPVPASLDDGITLDWSNFDDKHESKWRLNGTRRKGKEALPPSAVVREQQEAAYADKLGRLKSISSPQTIKKARMTRDQLGRRYNLIFDVFKSQTVPSPGRARPTVSSRLGTRDSLPLADRTPKSKEVQQQREADEQKAYDAKVRLLEQMIATNHRVRQLLNRISGDVREYDAIQSNAIATFGVAHLGLPPELVDAFGHDPAAVTGATRRFQGWRAVDDIQCRLVRQNEVFRSFLSCTQHQSPRIQSVLDDPISSLMQSLQALELHSQQIVDRALKAGESLKNVQAAHDAVKVNYNKTLARTSVVYPEVRRKSSSR